MRPRHWTILAAVVLVASYFALAGCGGDDSGTTNPPTGGGTPFNSGTLTAGQQFVFTFPTAGSFPYHCNVHSNMHGTITVATGGADSLLVDIQSMSFGAPQGGTTLKPGGYVHWRNVSGTHTVTSD